MIIKDKDRKLHFHVIITFNAKNYKEIKEKMNTWIQFLNKITLTICLWKINWVDYSAYSNGISS